MSSSFASERLNPIANFGKILGFINVDVEESEPSYNLYVTLSLSIIFSFKEKLVGVYVNPAPNDCKDSIISFLILNGISISSSSIIVLYTYFPQKLALRVLILLILHIQ